MRKLGLRNMAGSIFLPRLYMNNYQRFAMFYGNPKPEPNCNGSALLGEDYIWPTPTIGGGPCQARAQAQTGGNGHTSGTPITGYFVDLEAAPIGNRPVYRSYYNTDFIPAQFSSKPKPKSKTKPKSMLDRQFDCQHPQWCEKCI